MTNQKNAQLVYVDKEVDGKKYTNFYVVLGDGLLKVAVKLQVFNDKSLYGRVKRYCDQTNGAK